MERRGWGGREGEGGRQAKGSLASLQGKFHPESDMALAGQTDPGSFIKMAQAQAGDNQLRAWGLDNRSGCAGTAPTPARVLLGLLAASADSDRPGNSPTSC